MGGKDRALPGVYPSWSRSCFNIERRKQSFKDDCQRFNGNTYLEILE